MTNLAISSPDVCTELQTAKLFYAFSIHLFQILWQLATASTQEFEIEQNLVGQTSIMQMKQLFQQELVMAKMQDRIW